MITLNGQGRKVTLNSNARRVTVELSGWRLWFGWRRTIKRGKRKGEALPTSVTFSTEDIKRIRFRRASLLWHGTLIIDVPGAGDHWTATGRQRKHKIKFSARRMRDVVMLLFGLDLLTPRGVVDAGWAERVAAKHLPDRVAQAGKPTDAAEPRRGERVMRMSQDPRALRAAAAGSAARRATPPPRQPTPPPLGPVPEAMRTAARAARRRRPAAGMPPA